MAPYRCLCDEKAAPKTANADDRDRTAALRDRRATGWLVCAI
jgi:hypothetical protein